MSMAESPYRNGAVGGQNGSPGDVRYAGTGCSLSPRQLTRYIIVEVMNSQLTSHGYRQLPHNIDNPSSIQRTPPLHRLSEAARELVTQFEARYMETSQDLTNYQIQPERFHDAYHAIIAGIFVKGINWGRVIALLSLASMMSLTALRNNHRDQVSNILDWTCSYIVDHLWSWIMANDGWDGIIEMVAKPDSDSWDNLKNVALCTIGAIGILGFGVMLGKR